MSICLPQQRQIQELEERIGGREDAKGVESKSGIVD